MIMRPSIMAAVLAAAFSSLPAAAQNIDHLQSIIRGDYSNLTTEQMRGVTSARQSTETIADRAIEHNEFKGFVEEQANAMAQSAREAYIAAVPPADKPRARSILLGDGTQEGRGRLYYFVSRSMPVNLLRAYAFEAMHTGGTLVMKGMRKGDTVKEYVQEIFDEFNSAQGVPMSSVEMNPNLFDMFSISVVPATVWTNRSGLDDTGSGCTELQGTAGSKRIILDGPDENTRYSMVQPSCAPLPESSYFKIAGTVTTWHAIERFEEAGAPKEAMAYYKRSLARQHANVNQAGVSLGGRIAPLADEPRIDTMPEHVLLAWKDQLALHPVNRSPLGPDFDDAKTDDKEYRKELSRLIERGLR